MASFSSVTMKGHDLFLLLYFRYKLSQISLTEGLKSVIPCPSRPRSKAVFWMPAKCRVFRHKPGEKGGSNRSDLPQVTQLGVKDCPSQGWPWVLWIPEVVLHLSAALGGIEVSSQGSGLPPSSTQQFRINSDPVEVPSPRAHFPICTMMMGLARSWGCCRWVAPVPIPTSGTYPPEAALSPTCWTSEITLVLVSRPPTFFKCWKERTVK